MPAFTTFRRAALAALLLAPAARADAQRPCAAGSLERYLGDGFRCRIGGWALSDFSSHFSVTAGGGAQAVGAGAASVTVSPFVFTGADGRRTFGFDVRGLESAAGSHGTTSGTERAFGVSAFGFSLASVSAGGEIGAVRVAGAFDGANATPGALRVGSTYGGSALAFADGGGIVDCAIGLANSTAPGGPPASVGGECRAPLSGLIVVNLSTGSTADRVVGTGAVDGFSVGALTRVSFTEGAASTVPEPASVALLGAGLAGLGAFARRRRAATAR